MINALAVVLIAFLVYCSLIPWSVHRSQTREFSRSVARGDMKTFFREFASRNWERNERFPESCFDYSTDSEIHASIIRFGGVGMLLGPLSWFRVYLWIRRQRPQRLTAPIQSWDQGHACDSRRNKSI